MKLDKAIELNKESERSLRDGKLIDYADAVKLGIEAMIFLKSLRDNYKPKGFKLLPGETED